MKFLVLLNESAGTLAGMPPAEAQKRIADGFAAAGAEAEVRFIDMRFVDQHVREAAQTDIDALIAGGADGTLNSIANALAAAGRKPLGVLPLAVVNYLAKELGVPLELDDALKALANGAIEELPVGELNGRIFLSFGVLPPARRFLRVSTRGRTIAARARTILVCNNEDQVKAMGLQPSPPPERGMLNVYVEAVPKNANPLAMLWHRIFGASRSTRPQFNAMALPEIRVDSRRNRRVRVLIDGEQLNVRPPLTFRIRATPLRVLKPRRVDS